MLWNDWDRAVSWEPWPILRRVSEGTNREGSYPTINLWRGEDALLITAELPGVEAKDVEISVAGKVLTIHGRVVEHPPSGNVTYHRRERGFGEFSRTVELPYVADANGVDARFSRGVLHITIPRAEADKPKKITIKAGWRMTGPITNVEKRESALPTERTRARRIFVPRTDIYETADKIELTAEMPGVDEKSVNITLEQNVLTIDGTISDESATDLRLEWAEYELGDFHRVFTLGESIDRSAIEARVKNGLLRLSLPKSAEAKIRKIEVKTA
jgi:HSP20 family protein